MDTSSLISDLFLADITRFNSKKHELGYEDFGVLVKQFIDSLPQVTKVPNLWRSVLFVGVERQPIVGTRDILQVAAYIEMAVRCHLTPNVPVFIVNPKSVRAYFQSGATDYKQRKSNSWKADCMSHALLSLCKRHFKGHPDAIEALQLCLYLLAKGGTTPKHCDRDFACTRLRVQAHKPKHG